MKHYSKSQYVITIVVIVCVIALSLMVFTSKAPAVPVVKDYIDCTKDPTQKGCVEPIQTIPPCVDTDGSCKKG